MPGLTPKLPLIYSSTDGAYGLVKSFKELVKQNFKNLVLTSPGERIMDPLFGVGIRNFLFENDSDLLYSNIESTVQQQVTKYMPFVIILDITFLSAAVAQNMDNNYLSMTIEYTIGPLDTIDKLEITVPHN